MLSPAPFNESASLLAFIPLKGTVSISHNGAYLVPGWFRTVNIAVDGSIGVQPPNPQSLPHSCPFRLRAYQPRQAQTPIMETTMTTTRAKAFPPSFASTGRMREKRTSHMIAVAFGSSSLGAMLLLSAVREAQRQSQMTPRASRLPGPLSQSQSSFIPAAPAGCFHFPLINRHS